MASMSLVHEVGRCTLCADRFAATRTAHNPLPVVWFQPSARILIAGQAPGLQVHEKGEPFRDRSGDRLRAWLGLDESTFYDKSKIAILPMAFCFPGYSSTGSDLPPPPICAATWRQKIMDHLKHLKLRIYIGAYAQRWHLEGASMTVTQRVSNWQDYAPGTFVLPHPSWRNTAWLKKNPWFEAEVLPALQTSVKSALA